MYEFTPEQNATFQRAALWTKALAGATLLQSAVNFAEPGGHLMAKVVSFAIVVVVVSVLLKSSQALNSVVETEGDDIAHTMAAIDSWSHLFTVRIILVVLLLVSQLASVVLR